jgi:hypothetical protein
MSIRMKSVRLSSAHHNFPNASSPGRTNVFRSSRCAAAALPLVWEGDRQLTYGHSCCFQEPRSLAIIFYLSTASCLLERLLDIPEKEAAENLTVVAEKMPRFYARRLAFTVFWGHRLLLVKAISQPQVMNKENFEYIQIRHWFRRKIWLSIKPASILFRDGLTSQFHG